ncbi:lantibiotic dehydratase [Streptomyces violaceusniger]|uniref:lantibiotic dehydratase n=1 Tax=Streptomyces violaceusniger TaxID=68280 RepID=UPI00207330BE|nr:lantibiotic dehydratase [Streptomyces violaceusniger]
MAVSSSGDSVSFRAAEVGMLRMPLLPHTMVEKTVAADVGLDPRDRRQAERYLTALTADERIREALAISSPSLDHALHTLFSGAPMKPAALRKLVLGATRYVLRAAGRPTPFGLMAGVAPVAFADEARVRVGDAHRGAVRPDGGWLLGLIRPWESDPEVLCKLRVVTNGLAFRRGGRWVLPFAPAPDESDVPTSRTEEVSVRGTPAVELALECAQRPRTAGEIVERLTAAYPAVGRPVVEGLLVGLVQQGFLLTELRPPLTRTDPLSYLRDVLTSLGESEKADTIARVAKLTEGCEAEPLGAGVSRWQAAMGELRSLYRHDRPLQVDVRMDAEVVLPREVLREAERAATALWRAAAKNESVRHLTEYHQAFMERYGTGQAVPLMDVLDPHTGLGPPASYEYPASERQLTPEAADRNAARDEVLTEWALSAIAAGQREIVLDDAALERLSGTVRRIPPVAAELCAHLTAPSPEDLERGEFSLVLSQTTGSATPGGMFGRFAYLLDDPEPVARLAREAAASACRPQAEPVLLDFQPMSGGAANVARVPAFWDRRLSAGCFPDTPPGVTVQGVADVALAADEQRLYVVDTATGQEIVPQSATVLNFAMAPAAVRLLREIPAMGRPVWSVWSWGALENAPHLPRVRYGRTILAAARWRLSEPALTDSTATDEVWGRALDAWRGRWNVPRQVSVGFSDRRVVLDLSAPLHRALLRRDLARGGELVVHETPEACGHGENWLCDDRGNPHRSELLIPVLPGHTAGTTARTADEAVPRPGSGTTGTVTLRPVGKDDRRHRSWFYGKLYTATAQQEEVLVDHLPRLLAALPNDGGRWFFIRYADPHPHLRLRFHGDPDLVWSRIAPTVLDWADDLHGQRLAGRMVVDTYEPETVRYGGPEAIDAAERFFHHDSLSVIEQLTRLASGADTTATGVLVAAHYVDLVRQVHGEDWPDWFLAMPRDDEHHPFFRKHRSTALGLLVEGALDVSSRAARAQALRDFPAASRRAVLASVLHMHHNRLAGVRRDAELRSLAVARGMAATERDRRRNHR